MDGVDCGMTDLDEFEARFAGLTMSELLREMLGSPNEAFLLTVRHRLDQ
jgi:hypothetical protein